MSEDLLCLSFTKGLAPERINAVKCKLFPIQIFIPSRAMKLKLILLLFYSFCALTKGQNLPNPLSFRDTAFEYNDYYIYVSNTYLRGPLFLKSDLTIHNSGTQFLIIDPAFATVTGDNGVPKKLRNDRGLVFMPDATFKQMLKFRPIEASKAITFHFPSAWVTNQVLSKFEPLLVPLYVGAIQKTGPITIEVLKVTPHPTEYKVRVRIRYKGEEFLAVAFNNISALGDSSGKISNKIRHNHRMHHKEGKYMELASLTFPIVPGEKLQKFIRFENVFVEYSIKQIQGFDLKYTLRADTGANAPSEEKMKEEEKKQEE